MPTFENTWNWSNVIALASITIGGVAAFVTVQAETKQLEKEVTQIRETVKENSVAAVAMQAKSEARIMTYLQDIKADIKETRDDVREIRAAQLRKGS